MGEQLYNIVKVDIADLIKENFNMKVSREEEFEREYVTAQGHNLFFSQIERIKKRRGEHVNKAQMDDVMFITAPAQRSSKEKQALIDILTNGYVYNGRKYVRFGKSASQAKEGITVFVTEEIYDELMDASQLGITPNKCTISKYEAQRCLIFSGCYELKSDLPYIVVVDEYEKIIPNQEVRYAQAVKESAVNDKGEEYEFYTHEIVTGRKDIKISPFDGCGIHDPSFSELVTSEMNLKKKYTITGLQIRLPFFKGYSVAVPFKEWYKQQGVEYITDAFGNKHKVEDIDCIWNTTMFKAFKTYKNLYGASGWEEYLKALDKYEYHLGISKYSHHTDNIMPYTRMNYQYLQCLDLWNEKYVEQFFDHKKGAYDILAPENEGRIIKIAKYSTDLFERIIKGNKLDVLLMMGIHDTEQSANNINSKYIEACLINEKMFQDPIIKNFIYLKLKTLIKQMKLGKIYVKGMYHTVVGDVVGYMQYAAGLEPVGVLKAGEFYCKNFRQEDGEDALLSMRSPLMCPSEINAVKVVNDVGEYDWLFEGFKNQDIVMLNMYDLSFPQQGGIGCICPL